MEDEKLVDTIDKTIETTPTVVDTPKEETNPLKEELEKVQMSHGKRTEEEKLLYTFNRIQKQLKEKGIEVPTEEITHREDEDNRPLTVAEYKKLKALDSEKTAMTLADNIDDEYERELVKHHISNTIKPSGNAEQDLKNARLLVNSIKNGKIIEEVQRKTTPKTHSTGSGQPAKQEEVTEEFSEQELTFMKKFNMTKDDILKVRKLSQQK